MKVCVIPARGGSKRIPRKNIRVFCDRPMIAHSIVAARDAGCFDRIIVSTDDEEIAAVSRDWGAETPFYRPRELADDHAGTNAVVAHALNWLAGQGCDVELACCIYATAPFLSPEDVRSGLKALNNDDIQFAISMTSFPFPVFRAVQLQNDNRIKMIWPQYENTRSQDIGEAYHDAGAMYWGRVGAFTKGLSLFAPHSVAVVLPRYRVQDIDTLEDWRRAELMYRAIQDEVPDEYPKGAE